MYNTKSLFWGLINFSLVVLITFGLVGIGSVVRHTSTVFPARTITVSGQGEVSTTPDLATVSFSVVSQGASPEVVQTDNVERMNSATNFVKGEGIEDKDIKTSQFNLRPRYRYDRNIQEQVITGYTATQTVTVKIRDFDMVGMIVGQLPSLGINQINSVNYSIEDPETQRTKARGEAFNNAFIKAANMAAQNNVKIVRVVTFSENGFNPGPVFARSSAFGGDFESTAVPEFQPGSEDVRVNVNVTYEIR